MNARASLLAGLLTATFLVLITQVTQVDTFGRVIGAGFAAGFLAYALTTKAERSGGRRWLRRCGSGTRRPRWWRRRSVRDDDGIVGVPKAN